MWEGKTIRFCKMQPVTFRSWNGHQIKNFSLLGSCSRCLVTGNPADPRSKKAHHAHLSRARSSSTPAARIFTLVKWMSRHKYSAPFNSTRNSTSKEQLKNILIFFKFSLPRGELKFHVLWSCFSYLRSNFVIMRVRGRWLFEALSVVLVLTIQGRPIWWRHFPSSLEEVRDSPRFVALYFFVVFKI